MALVHRNAGTAERSGDEIALLGADGCYLAFANRDRRLLGAGAADLIGTAFIDTWPESVRALAEQALQQALSGGMSSLDAETHDLDGRSFTCHVVLSPLIAAETVEARVVVVASDVTQRKYRDQERLLQAERQMLQTEKLASVGRLAAGVAHEINTPIQYVGDNLHALSESFADLCRLLEDYRRLGDLIDPAQAPTEAIERVRATEREIDLPFILDDAPKAIVQGLEGVKRVASIVRAMKDFSHIKSGTAMSVDINGCLESTLTVARNEYKYVADVERHFDHLPGVECYPSELNQVFLNLLVNAAHAIQDTGRRGTITITTRAMDKKVEIAITDTGTGIPEEIRGKIYDPFFTTKEIGRGTGQGLYLAYQTIVGKHGGTLHCESEVGKGTTFHITLPIRLPEQHNDTDA